VFSLRESVFVMSDRSFSRLMRRYHEVVCRRCGEPIVVGDRVLTRNRGSRSHIYHVRCWDSLFLDV